MNSDQTIVVMPNGQHLNCPHLHKSIYSSNVLSNCKEHWHRSGMSSWTYPQLFHTWADSPVATGLFSPFSNGSTHRGLGAVIGTERNRFRIVLVQYWIFGFSRLGTQ